VAKCPQGKTVPPEGTSSLVSWHSYARQEVCACCCAGFLKDNGSCDILAHVLWMVYRYGFLLPGSAAGFSSVVAGIILSCGIGLPAGALADFLVCPSSLQRDVPKRMTCKWLGAIAGCK
jgi:hypothetical protein